MSGEQEPTRISEKLKQPVRVMLINMEGERDLSLHEPIGIEAVGARALHDAPNITLDMYDVQPELVRTGKVDTDKLADRIRSFANQEGSPFLLGIGVPIYSWEYTKALLIKLQQDPPKSSMTVVLGNAIPTYTKPELIKNEFPDVRLVVGEGEEIFANMANALARGETIEDSLTFIPPNLDNYVSPLRIFTSDVIALGGSVKVEGSRGCDYGACTFCSRCVRGGKDYRTVPEGIIVQQVQSLIEDFEITRFEFTDEEAFDDIEAATRLVSALKSADLPRVPFVASLRVDTLLRLSDAGLLDQLHEVGLDKVFLGVEGGSDAYLKQIAKGQTVEEVKRAIAMTLDNHVDVEIGYITFSWRMTFTMLRENIEFLSDGYAQHTSSLFNELAVRAGTLDEKLLRRYIAEGRITGYDPDAQFSVNLSYYKDVPFMDKNVAEVYKRSMAFSQADARFYYALKSLVRAGSLPEDIQTKAQTLYIAMKDVHLQFLRTAVGLQGDDDFESKRRVLAEAVQLLFESPSDVEAIEIVRREAKIFLSQEDEKKTTVPGDIIGSLAVCIDKRKRILLVRPRDEEEWAFPGGGVQEEETIPEAVRREVGEELGIKDITLLAEFPVITKQNHVHSVIGMRPNLVLHHSLVQLNGTIDIQSADYEIVDTLWLDPDDILKGRVKVRENVQEIARFIKTLPT